MDEHSLEARLAAIEVMLFAITRGLNPSDILADLKDEKEIALIGLLNNPTVSDRMHDLVEKRLAMYERHLNKYF